MKHLTLTRCLPLLLLALCPPLLNHCGGATLGTETGNPPVVNDQKLHLVLHGSDVELIGDTGAVTPGASVRLTNQRTGDSAEARANADGSVNVFVPGTLQDDYEVRISSGGESRSVPFINAVGPGLTADLTSLTCSQLENELLQRLEPIYEAADKSCTQASDCGSVVRSSQCFSPCVREAVSVAAEAATNAADEAASAPVCSEFESRCRDVQPLNFPAPCKPPSIQIPDCVGGVCQLLPLEELSCEALTRQATLSIEDQLASARAGGCSVDADCALSERSVSCVPRCPGHPQAVPSSMLPLLEINASGAEFTYCEPFAQRPCPLADFICVAPLLDPRPVCEAGACVVVSTPR